MLARPTGEGSELEPAEEGVADRGDDYDEAAAATDAAFDELTTVRTLMRESAADLERRRKGLEGRKLELATQNGGTSASPADKLKLNVGGVRVTALRETLTQFPNTRLAALFSGRWESRLLRDKKKRIFLDINPICFRKILAYHQLVKIAPPDEPPELPTVPDDMHYILERQLDFFGLTQEPQPDEGQTIGTFAFQSTGDINGVLHFLGTKQGAADWQNPHDSGQVLCSSSNGGTPQHLVGRSRQDAGWCTDARNNSVTCDLKTVQVKPVGYTLGHASCCVPSTWKLEGSTDGSSYTVLHQASGDRSITSGGDAYFAVTTGKDAFYRCFRLTCTGCDQGSGSCFCFHICNFELYGDMKV
jgi:hypothetical protein